MSAPHHLITEQDIHAYIDGELTPERQRAVEAFLRERGLTAAKAAQHLRATFDLRALRDEIYADADLRGEVERLMAKRGDRLPARAIA